MDLLLNPAKQEAAASELGRSYRLETESAKDPLHHLRPVPSARRRGNAMPDPTSGHSRLAVNRMRTQPEQVRMQ
jgi:hypothetical protein